jgi:hypothetical protein
MSNIRTLEQIRADHNNGVLVPVQKATKKEKISDNPDSDIINMYDLKGVQEHMDKNYNPGYCDHNIKLFFNGVICGASGSG